MARPFSLKRLLSFYIAQLPEDAQGLPGGADYRPYYKLRDLRTRTSLRAEDTGAWSGRMHVLAGNAEYKVFRALEGNPYIIYIREQYPFASPEILQAVLDGEVPAKNQVWTLDFLLTLPPLQRFGPLRYHGLSYKPDTLKETPAEQARRAKELATLQSLGGTWSYIQKPSDIEHFNNEKLHGWCKHRGIDEAWGKARELAALFYRTTSKKTLRGQLTMFAKRLQIPEELQWFTFAAAYYFGFIQIDHRFKLDEDGPLFLKEPRRE
ncbi:Tn7-like transposition protein A [Alicycliphilus sp. B1]|nr:Tn7-like transposition protein A [Alicycliphilus sp. B1]